LLDAAPVLLAAAEALPVADPDGLEAVGREASQHHLVPPKTYLVTHFQWVSELLKHLKKRQMQLHRSQKPRCWPHCWLECQQEQRRFETKGNSWQCNLERTESIFQWQLETHLLDHISLRIQLSG
jgi:hypothetical protein